MKFCKKCNTEKDEGSFYNTKKGLYSYCKECAKEARKKWTKENPEKNRDHQRKWNKEHPEDASVRSKKYRDKDPEKDRQKCKAWKKANPEKHRQWLIDNPEKVKASGIKYHGKRRAICKETDITIDYLIQLKEEASICPLCDKTMLDISIPHHPDQKQLDHIIPLSLGGKHIKNNVRYICGWCNNHRPRKGQDVLVNV